MICLGAHLVVVATLLAGVEESCQTAGTAAGAIEGRVTDATGAVLPRVNITLSGEALMGSHIEYHQSGRVVPLSCRSRRRIHAAFRVRGLQHHHPTRVRHHRVHRHSRRRTRNRAGGRQHRGRPQRPGRGPVFDGHFDQLQCLPTRQPAWRAEHGGNSRRDARRADDAFRRRRQYRIDRDLRRLWHLWPEPPDRRRHQPPGPPAVRRRTRLWIVRGSLGRYRSTQRGMAAGRRADAVHHEVRWQPISRPRCMPTTRTEIGSRSTSMPTKSLAARKAGIGLAPRDSNRMWSYRDVNADVGGYLKKDVIWWYSSVRDQDVSTRLVNFPVKPYRTHLSNFTAKTTYRATDRDRVIAFGQAGRNHQPNRLDILLASGRQLSVRRPRFICRRIPRPSSSPSVGSGRASGTPQSPTTCISRCAQGSSAPIGRRRPMARARVTRTSTP